MFATLSAKKCVWHSISTDCWRCILAVWNPLDSIQTIWVYRFVFQILFHCHDLNLKLSVYDPLYLQQQHNPIFHKLCMFLLINFLSSPFNSLASKIRYEITEGNYRGAFAVKNETGAIYVAGPLDYETRKEVSGCFCFHWLPSSRLFSASNESLSRLASNVSRLHLAFI